MKIIIVGASGTIGQAVATALKSEHEIITVGSSSGDYQVDMTDLASIKDFYKQIKQFDALVSTAGRAPFKPVAELTNDDFAAGLANKLMGQINLVMEGLNYISEKGSFTLTTGLLNQHPVKNAALLALVNGGLEGFVRGAAIDMPKQTRINVVSPALIAESVPKIGAAFKGFVPVPAATVALSYVKSVEGLQTGQVYKAGW